MRHLYFFGACHPDTPLNYLWEKVFNMCKIKKNYLVIWSKIKFMVWRGMWNPPPLSSQVPSFNLAPPPPPSNLRLPRSPLSAPQYHGVQKVWTPPSLDNLPLLWPSPLHFPNPPFLARLFRHYHINEILNKNKTKLMWQSYFFIFRRLKNKFKCFFYEQYFYKQHETEI